MADELLNPFADKNGNPKDGHLADFWEWQAEQTRKKNAALPDAERKKAEKGAESISKKMNA